MQNGFNPDCFNLNKLLNFSDAEKQSEILYRTLKKFFINEKF